MEVFNLGLTEDVSEVLLAVPATECIAFSAEGLHIQNLWGLAAELMNSKHYVTAVQVQG